MRILLLILLGCTFHLAVAQTACEVVNGMYVTDVTMSSATLAWEKNASAEGYLYTISKSAIPPEKFGRYLKDATLTEKGLASNATYYAHVRTKCAGTGISAWSTVQFNTPAPYNVNFNTETSFAFSVYPAQAEKSVTIKIKGSNEFAASVWIQNMYGEEVGYYPLIGDRLHVDIAQLKNGIYYVYYNDFYGRIQKARFTKMPLSVLNNN